MTTRRTFLKVLSGGLGLAAVGLPSRQSLADVAKASETEFFVFIIAAGGWDVTLWADPRNEAKGIVHPASTTHSTMPKDARALAHITDGLLRMSGGGESPDDLWQDLAQALEAAR